MRMHSQEKSKRQELLKWTEPDGFDISPDALAYALCIEDALDFYRSGADEEVNTPRDAFNIDLRVKKIRDLVCKHFKTAPTYLQKRDDDKRSRFARGAAYKCLRNIDGMSYPQLKIFCSPFFGDLPEEDIRAEVSRARGLFIKNSKNPYAPAARAVFREYLRKVPPLQDIFMEAERREQEIAQQERDRMNLINAGAIDWAPDPTEGEVDEIDLSWVQQVA